MLPQVSFGLREVRQATVMIDGPNDIVFVLSCKDSYKEMLHVLIGLNGLDLMYVYIMTSLTYTSSLYFSHSHPRPHEVGGKTEACQGAARGKGQKSW